MTDLCEAGTSHTRMPPAVRSPRLVQALAFALFRAKAMRRWIDRYGPLFEINVPVFGRSVVVADAALAKSVCAARPDQLANLEPSLGDWFGPGSTFALEGSRHRDQRRLLATALHGVAMTNIDRVIEEATLRESANWPDNTELRMLEPMNRITLAVILQVAFGTDGRRLGELVDIVAPYTRLGERLAFLPAPRGRARRISPWARLDELRTAFDRTVQTMITAAYGDPDLASRTDILAALVRARGRNAMSEADICDELLTLICAGHGTSAATLAWTFERLRRHPRVLAELVQEAEEGGSSLRRATIMEAMRVRTVIDMFGRKVRSQGFDLGPWRIPDGRNVLVRVADLHRDPVVFPHPERFDPHRFLGVHAAPTWLPFGGGSRRCIGVGFALAEMDVIVRTVLLNFEIHTDSAPDENAVEMFAYVPGRGGRIMIKRRRSPTCRHS